ncbi:MAG: tRNA pseudouridine(54/55) synthase Pus10 [Thaumarchaeota archaeon]|nr:tRNA pseudouridine(54/55) synthase Pus10 [Nitrososphaerota archaeon]
MDKKKLATAIDQARSVIKEHPLCSHCLGRMFAVKLGVISHKRLGLKMSKMLGRKNPTACYICKTLMTCIDDQVRKMISAAEGYEFSTFLIGAILQPSIHDRDDLIRSRLRLRGIPSIKSDVTRELGKAFSRRTKTVVDYQSPDITFTIDFKKDYCEVKPKAILLQGRYTKDVRGIPQKQRPCNECGGKGCFVCDFHGICEFTSVEGRIAKFLIEKFGAQQAKINWIGSEDESSLVGGTGRPFFVKLSNPHRRRAALAKKIKLEGVSLFGMKIIGKIPSEPVRFRTTVVMDIETESEVPAEMLGMLDMLKGHEVILHENSRTHRKTIYEISASKKDSRSFTILMESDGGLPLKRFVSGREVEPSISSVLGTVCQCNRFDFQKVAISSR